MQTNALPFYDTSVNTTGCCPRFNPEGWDNQDLHLRDRAFVRAKTLSAMHIPLNMGQVFSRVQLNIEEAGAYDPAQYIVLSHDTSPWNGEHLFAVSRPVENEEMTTLTGDYVTKVFEGPYSQTKAWLEDMHALVSARGKEPGEVYFFYTTCPKCAKAYGKNYIVGVAEL